MNDSLEAIRDRANQATPPPWNEFGTDPGDGSYCISGRVVDPKDGYSFFPRIVSVRALGGSPNIPIYKWDKANADFIAHARTDIPYLLDRLEAAERALVTARTALERIGRTKNLTRANGESADKRCQVNYGGESAAYTCLDKLEQAQDPESRIEAGYRERILEGAYLCDACRAVQALTEIAAVLGTEER